jgi:Cdc6-like AAA superfamily ATPase
LSVGARGTGKTVVARHLRDRFREVSMKAAGQGCDLHLNCAEFSGGEIRTC